MVPWGEGLVYEAFNLASLWGAPILFVIENNRWSQSTPIEKQMAGSMVARGQAFGIESGEIESTDAEELYEHFGPIVTKVRQKQRPHLEVIQTYRLCHHSKSDDMRPEEEIEARWVSSSGSTGCAGGGAGALAPRLPRAIFTAPRSGRAARAAGRRQPFPPPCWIFWTALAPALSWALTRLEPGDLVRRAVIRLPQDLCGGGAGADGLTRMTLAAGNFCGASPAPRPRPPASCRRPRDHVGGTLRDAGVTRKSAAGSGRCAAPPSSWRRARPWSPRRGAACGQCSATGPRRRSAAKSCWSARPPTSPTSCARSWRPRRRHHRRRS